MASFGIGRWATMAVFASMLGACVTPAENEAKEPLPPPPKIVWNMPVEEALMAGINYGSDTLTDVKKLVKKRGEHKKTTEYVGDLLGDNMQKWEPNQMINATHLLMSQPEPLAIELFEGLVGSARPQAAQLGWQLAAAKASPSVARAIDKQLTTAVTTNDEDSILLPQMANAVAANRLKSAYTLVRRGLMMKGDEEYANAMAVLDPAKASEDFMEYLALAPAEELRQLTVSSVNTFTCVAILTHMQKNPPSIGNPNFDHIFLYAVSRNQGLQELAQNVIIGYVPKHTETLAQLLAKHPPWVQIAFLEDARQKMSPKVGLLLGELRNASAEADVVSEIDEIKF